MKILIFSIIAILLSFMTSCDENKHYIPNDKGVVVNIKKVQNDNEVTIMMNRNHEPRNSMGVETYVSFLTHKQYILQN